MRISSLLFAIAIFFAFFFAPIVTLVAFGEARSSLSLYDALLDHEPSERLALIVALVMITASFALYLITGFGYAERARIASLLLVLTIIPFVWFHALATERGFSLFGYEVSSVTLAYGSFLYAIIGLLAIILAPIIDRYARLTRAYSDS